VRRHSRLTGTCEGQLWHRTDRRELRRIVLAARRYELAGRQRGRRTGPLGHVALEVLELLANLTDHRSGRLEPSLAYLMRQLRRSRDAIVRGLAALRAHGFADWMRRFERVEAEGPGPRVRQVSNAYRLVLPPRAARLLGARGQDVPLPDDVAQAQEDRREAVAALKASLGLDELPLVEVADDPLRRALAAMGRELEKRESGRRSEPQTEILI
jgi:hypothetical protein